MEIQNIPADQIKPYWRNPRKNEAAIPQVKESIEKYGYLQPIVVDSKNVIIVGHTRYRAMLLMGKTEIPCVVADLPPDKAKQYRIADNKTAEVATWNEDSLIQELRELGASATELQPFFDEDISAILKGMDAPFEHVTAAQLKKQDHTLKTRFEEAVKDIGQFMIKTNCPHCGKEVIYDRRELVSMVEIAQSEGRTEM
jgi:hypothetical protein